jgi:hypothetical protein
VKKKKFSQWILLYVKQNLNKKGTDLRKKSYEVDKIATKLYVSIVIFIHGNPQLSLLSPEKAKTLPSKYPTKLMELTTTIDKLVSTTPV